MAQVILRLASSEHLPSISCWGATLFETQEAEANATVRRKIGEVRPDDVMLRHPCHTILIDDRFKMEGENRRKGARQFEDMLITGASSAWFCSGQYVLEQVTALCWAHGTSVR